MKIRAVRRLLAVAAVMCSGVLAVAAPANAAGGDGTIDSNELSFFCHSTIYKASHGSTGPHGYGKERDFAGQQKDLAGFTWVTGGHCETNNVKNNASHVWNARSSSAQVFYNSYGYAGCWCGVYDPISGNYQTDLSASLANNNAAFRWV